MVLIAEATASGMQRGAENQVNTNYRCLHLTYSVLTYLYLPDTGWFKCPV